MKRPWMAFYPQDFMTDTLELTTQEIGVYVVMICLAWRRGDGSVSGDMTELKKTMQRCITDFHGLTFNKIVPRLLSRYFELRNDGRYYQPRVEKELRKAEELSEKQSRNAKERWAKPNNNNGLGNAKAMPLQPQSQSKERIGAFRKMGEARSWPTHGCVSKARGTIWLRAGSSDYEAYAADYFQKNKIHPTVDKNGGNWFSILGETG